MLLTSIRALVTRPQIQAQALAEAIQIRQGQAWTLPMLAIVPVTENQQMRNTLLALDQFNKVIVTSHHAALFGLELIDQYWPQLPFHLQWHAIGSKTACTLANYDVDTETPPKGVDSESLLAMDSLTHVDSEKILIIKGKGGRSLLEETLRTRGATVECLETYQRQAPEYPENTLPNLLEKQKINVILCASGETVENLLKQLPENQINDLSLIVPSQRVADQLAKTPFQQVIVAEGASNEAMLSALAALEQQQRAGYKIKKHSEELS